MSPKTLCIALVLAPFLAGDAHAQAGQTVEGAQRFLAQMQGTGKAKTRVRFEEVQRSLHNIVYTNGFLGWKVSSEETSAVKAQVERAVTAMGASAARGGEPDYCRTAINGIEYTGEDRARSNEPDFNAKYATSKWVFDRSVAEATAPPAHIDWSNARIFRDTGGVMATSPHPRFRNVSLIFLTAEPELQDRIDYAMRFLQMSCDATADTGF